MQRAALRSLVRWSAGPLLTTCAAALPASAEPLFIGPTAYLQGSDSPLVDGSSFAYFHLEDFEDADLDTPGVSASSGFAFAGTNTTDSVDGDVGGIDGSGAFGGSYIAGGQTVTFTFDASALGDLLPTHVGLVWTDVWNTLDGTNLGFGSVIFEAFDAGGISLGSIGPSVVGDGQLSGSTSEDRFFGIVHLDGISKVSMTMTNSNDWELDHLQYGAVAPAEVPEPASLGLVLAGFAALALARRPRRAGARDAHRARARAGR